jgi:A/G-specific adenine glycosylase
MAGATDALSAADLQRLADASVPADRPADWTHALMDVGATVCRSGRPACEECPARPWCRYSSDRTLAVDAAPLAGSTRSRERAAPFSSSTRWLRGRILDRLRDVDGSAWLEIAAPIGDHDGVAVTRALGVLAAEGLVERDPDSELRVRLPQA